MRIKFEKALLSADDYGEISLFETDYQGEVSLGKIDDQGEFIPSYWLEVDRDFEQTLRERMLQMYFAEAESYVKRAQEDWPECYLKWMQLESYDFSQYDSLEKVSEDLGSGADVKGRYRKSSGEVCNGFYLEKNGDWQDLLVLNHGVLLYQYRIPVLSDQFSISNLHFENLHASSCWKWKDTKGEDLAVSSEVYEQIISGKKPLGSFYVGHKKWMEEKSKKLMDLNLKFDIYPHQSDEHKFRFVVAKEDSFDALFGMSALGKQYQACIAAWKDSLDSKKFLELESAIQTLIEDIKEKSITDYMEIELEEGETTIKRELLLGLLYGYPIETSIAYVIKELLT